MSRWPSSVNDHPLSFHWNALDPGRFDQLGLPLAKSRTEEKTLRSILTEAYLVGRADPARWIWYSRNKNWYSQAPRYRNTAFTYSTVTRTVDLLEQAGLIEHKKGVPGDISARADPIGPSEPRGPLWPHWAPHPSPLFSIRLRR